MPTTREPSSHPIPSRGEIFFLFLVIGATSFGGGATAHIQDAVVHRRRWMGEERFLQAMTMARSLPGTNVTNVAAFIGSMLGGYRGALLAVVGVVAPGVVFVLGASIAYQKLAVAPVGVVASALHGLTAGAVGVMAQLAQSAARATVRARGGVVFAAAAFAGVAVARLDVIWVLLALVPIAALANRGEAA